jgi:hypothetical protein
VDGICAAVRRARGAESGARAAWELERGA